MGLASISAALCGMRPVVATDGDAAVLPLLEQNLRANAPAGRDGRGGDGLRVSRLDWGDEAAVDSALPPELPPPDLVLAADVVYLGSRDAWRSLLRVVATLCRRRREWHADERADPLVLFSQTRRLAREYEAFVRLARASRFDVRAAPHADLHPAYRSGRSEVFSLRWRGDP